MINTSEWVLQYPSGTKEGGMLTAAVNNDTKYFRYDEATGSMRFSLNASEKGKSPNGSSVRVELKNNHLWTLKGQHILAYRFAVVSSDIDNATFTVGQFLQCCEQKHSPLCRIEIQNGKIVAIIKNYMPDGVTISDGKAWEYSLGKVQQGVEITVKLMLEDKTLRIDYNGVKAVEHTFTKEVSDKHECYFKLGLYYQSEADIMTEVKISECECN